MPMIAENERWQCDRARLLLTIVDHESQRQGAWVNSLWEVAHAPGFAGRAGGPSRSEGWLGGLVSAVGAGLW